MPSILEDPNAKNQPSDSILLSLKSPSVNTPLKTTSKTGANVTLYPITNGPSSLPQSLLRFLHAEFSAEIEKGCTYPMEQPMKFEAFGEYWFGMFGVVAVLDREGDDESGLDMDSERDWENECLGTFYVKPNYPARNQGVGMVMGKAYLHFAPLLGYKYSVFNLVFENNVASVKIWKRLGFSIIGRVPGAARLANSEAPVDALIIGKDLTEEVVVDKT
ncbi:hypothetical protein BDW72DRAFT_203562 [Aspergillus terricola var. indicus]